MMSEHINYLEDLKKNNSLWDEEVKAVDYAIKAVNEHDGLVAEIERLKCVVELINNLKQQADTEIERLEKENEQNIRLINGFHGKVNKLNDEIKQLKEALKEYSRLPDMDNGTAIDKLFELISEHEKLMKDGE